MAEPDNKMQGSRWPAGWQTGWVTWIYADMVGRPIEGFITLSLSVDRAVSVGDRTTIMGGSVVVDLENGVPSPMVAVKNDNGDWVVEVPLSDDPDILPSPIFIMARESFSGTLVRKVVSANHTFNNPLWLSGTLSEATDQPGVVPVLMWEVDSDIPSTPVEALPGDYIFYVKQGTFTRLVDDADASEEPIE